MMETDEQGAHLLPTAIHADTLLYCYKTNLNGGLYETHAYHVITLYFFYRSECSK